MNTRRPPQAGLAVGVLLVALAATAPLSVDMFLPSMPAMTAEFDASESTMQLGVTLFIVAFAGSQLFYGPISDRVGRRPVMFVGLGLFIAGSAVALFATSPAVFVAGRVLQGFGGGVGPTLANAMVIDIFDRERAVVFIGYMSIALPLAPAIAPIIGGILQETLGWQSVFVTLGAIGVVLLIAYWALLPETRPPRGVDDAPLNLGHDYRTLLTNPTFLGYAAVMGLMFGAHLMFISMSSFVLIDGLGLSPGAYGFAFGFVALGIMFGATLSRRLVRQFRPRHVVLLGAATSTAGGAVMVALALAGVAHPMSVLLPMFAVASGLGMTRPSAMAGALVPFPQMAGLASALLGFSQMTISAGFNIAYTQVVSPGVTALAAGVLASVGAALVTVLLVRPGAREERALAAEAAGGS